MRWRSRLTWALVVVGVCGVLALLAPALENRFDTAGSSTETAKIVENTAGDRAPTSTAVKGVRRAPDAHPPLPLPPVGTPLHLVFDQLKQRADRGDPRAACRLAVELDACRAAVRAAVRQAGTRQATERVEDCGSVPHVSTAQRTRYWRTAAAGGNVPAMTRYALGRTFPYDGLMDNLPELAIYRRQAQAMAREAASLGDPRAAYALAEAYAPDRAGMPPRSLLAQVVSPDPVEALSIFLVLRNAFPLDTTRKQPVAQYPDGIAGSQLLANRLNLTSPDSYLSVAIDALEQSMPAGQQLSAQERARQKISSWQPIRVPTPRGDGSPKAQIERAMGKVFPAECDTIDRSHR